MDDFKNGKVNLVEFSYSCLNSVFFFHISVHIAFKLCYASYGYVFKYIESWDSRLS